MDDHPLLVPGVFRCRFPGPLSEVAPLGWLTELLDPAAKAPVERSEDLRTAVRDLLRAGGYKPTGRGKPSSEYLVRAVEQGKLGPINPAVDCCNAASYHSGLPISVVDLDRAAAPLRIAIADPDTRYVFNGSGQEIDCSGLLCLFDAEGPCANAVKDSQRTKTHPATRNTLSVVWGVKGWEPHVEQTVAWYRELLQRAGAQTE